MKVVEFVDRNAVTRHTLDLDTVDRITQTVEAGSPEKWYVSTGSYQSEITDASFKEIFSALRKAAHRHHLTASPGRLVGKRKYYVVADADTSSVHYVPVTALGSVELLPGNPTATPPTPDTWLVKPVKDVGSHLFIASVPVGSWETIEI